MRYLMAFAMVLALSVAAYAQEKTTPEERFKKLDKDGDNKVSLAEFKGKRQGEKGDKAEATFKRRDKNSDGFLSLEEFKAGGKKKK